MIPLAWKRLNVNQLGKQVIKTLADMTDAEEKSMNNKMDNINKNALLRNPNAIISNNMKKL